MEITFQYGRDEYARGFWTHCRKSIRPKADLFVFFSLVLVGGYFYIQELILWAWLSWLIPCLYILAYSAGRFFIPYYSFEKNIRVCGEYTLKFSKKGIQFRATGMNSTIKWSLYKSLVITSEFYLLYYGKNQCTIIPRRIFSTEEATQVFESLVCEKIKTDIS